MMPKNLILVRHGESESNIATKKAEAGDSSVQEKLFAAKHDSLVCLTKKGVEQAKLSGQWLRENFPAGVSGRAFGRCYVSEYVRAMETAGHLGIEGAEWFVDSILRERNRGIANYFTPKEVEESAILRKFMILSATEPYYWLPIGGESIADMCDRRIRIVLDTLHRECEHDDVVIVCHGEVMWGFRILLERISQEKYKQLDASKDPNDRIYNGQIIHYTRNDPFERRSYDSYKWMRSACPTLPHKVSGDWRPIIRKKYTNEELLARVSVHPPVS